MVPVLRADAAVALRCRGDGRVAVDGDARGDGHGIVEMPARRRLADDRECARGRDHAHARTPRRNMERIQDGSVLAEEEDLLRLVHLDPRVGGADPRRFGPGGGVQSGPDGSAYDPVAR